MMATTSSTGRIAANIVKLLEQRFKNNQGELFCCPIGSLHRASHLNPFHSRGYYQSVVRCRSFGSVTRAWTRSGLCKTSFGELPRSHSWRLNAALRYCKEAKSALAVRGGGIAVGQFAPSVGSGSVDALKAHKGILAVVKHYGECYFELSKARLSFFVVTTAAAGYVMGSGQVVDWMGLAWTSVGTMLTAASANSFNQILEIKNDGLMKRTMRRPLPAGRMSVLHALAFALTTGITGVTLLACKTTSLAAELGAANVLLYSLVYTPLKQIHSVNTWVGAVVGAIPPLIGWAAATGHIDAGGWVLASALYFWQIPHFMALSYLCRKDYAAGGYKMFSLLDISGQRTASCAMRNCIYLLPLGFLAQHLGTTSGYFGTENVLLTAMIGATSVLFYLRPSPETARRMFRMSLVYLPIVMGAMVIHRIPNSKSAFQGMSLSETVRSERLPHSGEVLTTAADDEELIMTGQHIHLKNPARPPIAFLSAAPFPFLPTPDFVHNQN